MHLKKKKSCEYVNTHLRFQFPVLLQWSKSLGRQKVIIWVIIIIIIISCSTCRNKMFDLNIQNNTEVQRKTKLNILQIPTELGETNQEECLQQP